MGRMPWPVKASHIAGGAAIVSLVLALIFRSGKFEMLGCIFGAAWIVLLLYGIAWAITDSWLKAIPLFVVILAALIIITFPGLIFQ